MWWISCSYASPLDEMVNEMLPKTDSALKTCRLENGGCMLAQKEYPDMMKPTLMNIHLNTAEGAVHIR